MYKILVCDQLSRVAIGILEEAPDVEFKEVIGLSEKELIEIIPRYNAVIVRSSTHITPRIIDKGDNLKVIGRAGSGIDNIDSVHALKKGIKVLNAPGTNAPAVAELTIGFMFSLARSIPQANQSIKEGQWAKKDFIGIELAGKKLGIIGFGVIGKSVAQTAIALNMEVFLFDHSHNKAQEYSYESVSSEKLFSECDFISIHLPLTEKTKNFITRKELSLMKESAFLINTSRGGIVNEADLLDAVKSKKIAGAALDVFENEPNFNKELASLPQIIATPHIAAASAESQERVGVVIIDHVLEFLRSKYIFF